MWKLCGYFKVHQHLVHVVIVEMVARIIALLQNYISVILFYFILFIVWVISSRMRVSHNFFAVWLTLGQQFINFFKCTNRWMGHGRDKETNKIRVEWVGCSSEKWQHSDAFPSFLFIFFFINHSSAWDCNTS